MVKHFCDICGKEVGQNVVYQRLNGQTRLKNVPVNFEVMLGVGKFGQMNSGDMCVACLRDLMKQVLGES